MIKLIYLRTETIGGVEHNIYLDKQTLHFVAITLEWVSKYVENPKGDATIRLGAWASFESYESLKDGVEDYLKHKDEPIERDPEEKHWDDVATFNERFSGDY